MENIMEWNPSGAETNEELMNVLRIAACGLKNQVLSSPSLSSPALAELKDRISQIADELHGLQLEASGFIPPESRQLK